MAADERGRESIILQVEHKRLNGGQGVCDDADSPGALRESQWGEGCEDSRWADSGYPPMQAGTCAEAHDARPPWDKDPYPDASATGDSGEHG